ncbi:Pleckstrin homology domain-containing family G member 1 [Schistosoma japonicum]|uniref:Pleckstrin homology domain-containing family G member 1 n=1 Tax=Schistosoma japonicum TaxID=6182 RepID=A0A4Z2CW22_SCHJA|nr:Pleckstrin homology domain-containing family G member 1 [Schistosoma japonicum]
MIKLSSDRNGDHQHVDNIGSSNNNHVDLFYAYCNNNLLNSEHITDSIIAVNVQPFLKQLQCVIGELIESESAYLRSLCDIEEGYLLRLKKTENVDPQFLNVVFHRIPDLRVFHAQLHSGFSLNRENFIQLGQVFLDNAKHFEELYVDFCLNYPKTIHLLEEVEKSRADTWTYLSNCQLELQHQLPLATYLLKPVQRVLKYQLLLQECLKHLTQTRTELLKLKSRRSDRERSSSKTLCNSKCDSNDGGSIDVLLEFFDYSICTLRHALERMIQVADHINERKRYFELLDQLRITRLDVDNWGDLVLCDHFRIPGKKGLRLILLFQCALILCKYSPATISGINLSTSQSSPLNDYWSNTTNTVIASTTAAATTMRSRNGLDRGSGNSSRMVLNVRSIEIREVISCANLMLVECIDKDPLAFHILPFDNPKAQRTLQAINLEVKRLWCREIKRLILENYDAAIPERAKQIVLNMADLTYGPPIQDTSDLPISVSDLQHVGTLDNEQERLNRDCLSHRVHRKSDTALLRLRSFLHQQTNKHSIYSNPIQNTPNLSLDDNIIEPCGIPLPTNECILNGNKNVSSDNSLLQGSDSNNNSTDRHLDSLLHEAWEEIWARHEQSKPVKATFVNGHSDSSKNANNHQVDCKLNTKDSSYLPDPLAATDTNDADFRCIAVEINEEKFGLSSSPLAVPICTTCEDKICSAPSLSKLSTDSINSHVNNSDSCKSSVPSSPSQYLFHYPSSPPFPPHHQRSSSTSSSVKPVHNRDRTTSVYIDCPNASCYDVVTFGRTYEQYITKARAMVALSPKDLDEIFSPLRELEFTDHENGLSPSSIRYHHRDQEESLLSNAGNRCTSTLPLTLNTDFKNSVKKQRSATTSTITMNKNRNCCLTAERRIPLSNLTSPLEHEDDAIDDDGEKSNGNCSSGASSPRHLVSRIALTQNKHGLSNKLITKDIIVTPNNIPYSPTMTTNNRVPAVRSNSLSSGLRTSELKMDLDHSLINLDRRRRLSNLDPVGRTNNRLNSYIPTSSKSPSSSRKQFQSNLITSNVLSNKSGVSRPPRFLSYNNPSKFIGKVIKDGHGQSLENTSKQLPTAKCTSSSSSLINSSTDAYDMLNKRGRRKSRAPAPPAISLEHNTKTSTTTTNTTATTTITSIPKAPLAVSECGKDIDDNDDDCIQSAYQSHVNTTVASSMSTGSCSINSQHYISNSFQNRINTLNNNNSMQKPIKPPRRLNSVASTTGRNACSSNPSSTLRNLHTPTSSYKFSHENSILENKGIVKNMISRFQRQ